MFAGLVFLSLSVASVALTPESIQPNQHNDGAVIRVYGADVWGIRGRFAIHTWIATKAADDDSVYTARNHWVEAATSTDSTYRDSWSPRQTLVPLTCHPVARDYRR